MKEVPTVRVSDRVVVVFNVGTLSVVMVLEAESTKMPALVVVGVITPDQIHSQAKLSTPPPLVPQ